MQESQWAETQLQLKRLETLLPILPASTEASPRSTYLTPEQEIQGWRRWMAMMIRRGWTPGEDGHLHRGKGREAVSCSANGFIGPWRAPWDPLYNPRVDAPAAIRGATFVSPNRYRLGMHTMDENGRLRDERECPECGSLPGIGLEILHVENPNPHAPRWTKGWTWCRTCIRLEGERVVRLRER